MPYGGNRHEYGRIRYYTVRKRVIGGDVDDGGVGTVGVERGYKGTDSDVAWKVMESGNSMEPVNVAGERSHTPGNKGSG